MQQIIELVQTLIDKGYAYESNGDVYYRTLKFKDYGKLSHQPLEDLQAGARIAVGEHKEDPMVLHCGRAAKPGEPQWNPPGEWGGRAGTSSVRPCPTDTWARPSICTAAVRI